MENTFTDKITDMKFDKYNFYEEKNFAAKNELLVTITLHEYRELLQKEAKAEASNAMAEKYKLETEVRELKKEIENLKAVIDTLGRSASNDNLMVKGDE